MGGLLPAVVAPFGAAAAGLACAANAGEVMISATNIEVADRSSLMTNPGGDEAIDLGAN